MNLYEVIRWGNDSEDLFTVGPNGADTCFLVRAESVEQAARLVDDWPPQSKEPGAAAPAEAVYLLGTEHSSQAEPRILRGPYVQHAHRHGWRHWYREDAGQAWTERR